MLTLLALVLASPCDAPELQALPEDQRDAACALSSSPIVDSSPEALVTLDDVFERPEFATARHRTGSTLKVLLGHFLAWLESLFESSGAQVYSNVTRIAVLVVAVLVASSLALKARARRRARVSSDLKPELGGQGLPLEDPTVHLARANALLETDSREAIREGLYALLSLLEHRRWARTDRVKTNRELARELPSRGAPSAVTERVTGMLAWYDRAFYSRRDVSRADAEHFISEITSL